MLMMLAATSAKHRHPFQATTATHSREASATGHTAHHFVRPSITPSRCSSVPVSSTRESGEWLQPPSSQYASRVHVIPPPTVLKGAEATKAYAMPPTATGFAGGQMYRGDAHGAHTVREERSGSGSGHVVHPRMTVPVMPTTIAPTMQMMVPSTSEVRLHAVSLARPLVTMSKRSFSHIECECECECN